MRKVLSFVLVLSLVLGSFGMAFASYSDMADESSAEAVDVLAGLGVISGYPDGTFRPDNIVTRAEMAKLIVAALGLEDYATATTSQYPDMGAAAWAQGYVAYGTSLGFISGYPDGTFKPNNTVTYEEACSMILRALGYTSEFLPGTWPAEWVVKAKSLSILDGIKAATAMGANRGDIAEMLYNALDLSIGYVDKDGVWQTYEDGDDTMLVRLGATLVEADDLEDGVIYGGEKSVINLRPYVGAYADRYLNEDDKIIKVVPVSEFLEGEFTSTTVFETTDGVEYKLASSITGDAIPFFVNGSYADDAYKADLSHESNLNKTGALAVDIDGKYISEVYSVLYWDVTDAFLVDEDILEELEDDDTLNTHEFELNSKDEIDLNSFDLLGIDELSDLEEDYVVYVYVDDNGNGEIRKIEVGTEVVKGEITRVASNGNVTVGGKAYKLSDEADIDFNFAVEQEVELYLDYAGKIFDADLIEGEADNVALVLDVAAGSPGLNGTDTKFKLFLADGTTKTFVADQDEMLEDGVIEVSGSAYAFTSSYSDLDLIEYGLNKDGEIVEIEAYDKTDVVYAEPANVTARGFIDGYKIAADATVFTGALVTSGKAITESDDDYAVSSLNKILDATYTAALYNVNDKQVVDLIVIQGAGDSSDAVYGVLNDTFTTSDWDYGVEVLVDGVFKEYGATTNVTDMSKLYKITFNTDGEAVMTTTENPMTGYDDVAISDFKNGRAYKSANVSVAVDADAFVYLYEDGEWTVGKTSDIKGKNASFFATDSDEPALADVVLVWKSTPAL